MSLETAVSEGKIDVVRHLSAMSWSPSDIQDSIISAIVKLRGDCRLDMIGELLQFDTVDIGFDDNSAIWWACQEGDVDVINLLMSTGQVPYDDTFFDCVSVTTPDIYNALIQKKMI